MTQTIINHIKAVYDVEPEFLWAKTPNNAAFRHKKTKKWFAALLLDLPKEKLGMHVTGNVDVLNLKCDPILKGSIVDGVRFFPGYHMNKEHWITILLDGSVGIEEIIPLIDLSFSATNHSKE